MSRVTITKYGAEWCVPCKKYDPELDKVRADGYHVEKIDIDEAGNAAAGITSVPFTVISLDGEIVKTFIGAKPYSALINLIREIENDGVS